MTDSEPQQVTQADREAAASFYQAHLSCPGEVPVAAAMRMRHIDESPLIQAFARHRLTTLTEAGPGNASTPAARWRENGEPDPHGDRYSRDRARLCGGHMTDDEIANAVYLDPSIVNLTAAKERIRWLSRALAAEPIPAPDVLQEALQEIICENRLSRCPCDEWVETDPAQDGPYARIARAALSREPGA